MREGQEKYCVLNLVETVLKHFPDLNRLFGSLKDLRSSFLLDAIYLQAHEKLFSTFAASRNMEKIDLVAKSTVDDLIFTKFESPLPKAQDDDDPFIKGEFDVIKELLEKFPQAIEGKKKIDRVIDICGPSPKGA